MQNTFRDFVHEIKDRKIFQVFIDGSETAAQLLTLCFYFVAANPDVQEKAFEEVEAIGKDPEEALTYDDVKELKYLDMVFSETGRKGPFPLTNRRCTKDWDLPGYPGVTIPKGMRVVMSIAGLHVSSEFKILPRKITL